MQKPATTSHPITEWQRQRWSPTVFEDRPLLGPHLDSLFEAARWSASCFNEQPWNFVLASRHQDPGAFAALLSCLSPGNQAWVKNAPLLMFSVAKRNFDKTGQPNRYAWYDCGQAVAHLSIEAQSLGIMLHQMAGFDAALATAAMKLPETHEPVSAIALGYEIEEAKIPADAMAKEKTPRARKPTGSFVFKNTFGA